jgi:hypothetical protein
MDEIKHLLILWDDHKHGVLNEYVSLKMEYVKYNAPKRKKTKKLNKNKIYIFK